MHTLITLQFCGTNYHGFQVQKNALAVCEVLQNAMEKLYGTRPNVKGCSRTDAGVHAMGYRVSYTQPKPIDLFRLPLALNRYLPPDIRVSAAQQVPPGFHARYDALSKEYLYHIHNAPVDDVFQRDTAWRCAQTLDVPAMQSAAALLCGTHDFSAFMSAGSGMEDTVRTVHFFTLEKKGLDLSFHICADGYLYNMVRILVGTLVEVGAHRMQAQQVRTVLESKDRSNAGDTAPAKGLFLYKVNYDAASLLLPE